jgi:hypothetical protein
MSISHGRKYENCCPHYVDAAAVGTILGLFLEMKWYHVEPQRSRSVHSSSPYSNQSHYIGRRVQENVDDDILTIQFSQGPEQEREKGIRN